MKVAMLGLGYTGTVTATCLASHRHDIWGVDVDAAKVDEIRAGRSPVAEPVLDALTGQAVIGGTFHGTTSCLDAVDRADVSLACVGPPSAVGGPADLSYIRRSAEGIAGAMRVVDAVGVRSPQCRHPQQRTCRDDRDGRDPREDRYEDHHRGRDEPSRSSSGKALRWQRFGDSDGRLARR